MALSVTDVVVLLIVGGVSGWLAGLIVRGYGLGLLGNVVVGLLGGFVGYWLLPKLGVSLGGGLGGVLLTGLIGAVVLLLVLGVLLGLFRRPR